MKNVNCKKCGSYNKVKAGFVRGRQRYKCSSCKSRYIGGHTSGSVGIKYKAVELYLEGVSIRGIGRLLKVSHVTILAWLEYVSELLKPIFPLKADHIEIDELYLYIKTKKRKRWLWLALCRETKRILGFQVGGRNKSTLQKLYNKISVIESKRYYTDGHAPYKGVLPKKKHRSTPGQTNTIEGINSAIRHYLARFRRRSKCYSKSLRMVEITINLFANKFNQNIA